LRAFVEQGGAVLIATDMRTEGEAGKELEQLARVTVMGDLLACRHVISGRVYDQVYHDIENCPIVQPAAGDKAGDSRNILGDLAALVGAGNRPELFRSPHPEQPMFRVATNAPSYLGIQFRSWLSRFPLYRLAYLPQGCIKETEPLLPGWTDLSQERKDEWIRRVQPTAPLFAVGGTVGKGRVLVLADHSIFINRMILPRDNTNLEFAANCLHWLRGGVSNPLEALRATNDPQALQKLAGEREKVLFWDDGKIRTNFEVPLKMVPTTPSEQAIVAALDRTITRMETNDVFNRRMLEMIDDIPGGRNRFLRGTMAVLTLAALLLAGYVIFRHGRHRQESGVPLLAYSIRQHEPRGSVLEQRRRALLQTGNVWETAHQLAREHFESAGLSLHQRTPPQVLLTDGSGWLRWKLSRRVARLWRLARGDAPEFISPAALRSWLRDLDELKSALAKGTVQLRISD
jgi:hypothetical protein